MELVLNQKDPDSINFFKQIAIINIGRAIEGRAGEKDYHPHTAGFVIGYNNTEGDDRYGNLILVPKTYKIQLCPPYQHSRNLWYSQVQTGSYINIIEMDLIKDTFIWPKGFSITPNVFSEAEKKLFALGSDTWWPSGNLIFQPSGMTYVEVAGASLLPEVKVSAPTFNIDTFNHQLKTVLGDAIYALNQQKHFETIQLEKEIAALKANSLKDAETIATLKKRLKELGEVESTTTHSQFNLLEID